MFLDRSGTSQAGRHAAEAALARLSSNKPKNTHFNTSLAAIQAQVKNELEAERKKAAAESSPPSSRIVSEAEYEASPLLAVSGGFTDLNL